MEAPHLCRLPHLPSGRKKEQAHERETREGTRVSPSCAPVFSCAHYFHAPATQANKMVTNCDSFKSVCYKLRWTVITNCESFLITKSDMVNYCHFDISSHILHFRKRLTLPQPQGFTEKFTNIRGLFLRRIRGTFE